MQSDDTDSQAKTPPSAAPEQSAPATRRSKAGKLGGTVVREKYGSVYFAKIGQCGGQKVRDTLGLQFYQGIGQAGGKKVAAQRGKEFYREIGRRGGQAQRRKKPGNDAGTS